MKFQLDKCEFLQKVVEFLNFIVGLNGIRKNPKKLKAIVKIHFP